MTTKRLLLALSLPALCGRAQAHGSVRGLGDFFGGFVHPLVEPAHLVALVALLLLVAQRGVRASTATMVALAAGSAAGLAVAAGGWPAPSEIPLLVVAALTGLIVTVARAGPGALHLAIGAAVGLGIGVGSAPEDLQGASRWVSLAGTWLGTCMLVASGATLLEELRRPWVPVLTRVVASWMTATALLVLALHTAAPKAPPDALPPAPPAAVESRSSPPA